MRDLYILSDLHLGEGWSTNSQRHSRMESFFYDREFANLVDRIIVDSMARRTPASIILNGDVFDFLAVLRLPDNRELRREGFRLRREEHKLGLDATAVKSAWKMEQILRGHPVFVTALVRAIRAEVRIVIIRGNHDVELHFQEVRERLYTTIAAMAGTGSDEGHGPIDEDAVRELVDFEDWFYFEPGRAVITHGNQYEPSNSFRFNLHPLLPARFTDAGADVLDYPTGSHFVRYVFNRIKSIDPFSPYYVSWERYLSLLGRASFFDILRIVALHMPFVMNTLKAVRFFELHGMEEADESHRNALVRTAEEKGLDFDTIQQLDALNEAPVGKTKYTLLQEVMRPVFRTAAFVGGLVVLSVAAWFVLFNIIQSTEWLATSLVAKASLMAVLSVSTIVGLVYVLFRVHRTLSAIVDPFEESYPRVAEKIAVLFDVPFVSMGHTHGADLRPFSTHEGFYANTGTWIVNPSPWDIVKPKARQFTFVRLRGVSPELLRWEDSARRWEPVPLLEVHTPSALERLMLEDG